MSCAGCSRCCATATRPPPPQPGLEQLEALLEQDPRGRRDRRARSRATWTALPAEVDLAAYRIVQEALTNVPATRAPRPRSRSAATRGGRRRGPQRCRRPASPRTPAAPAAGPGRHARARPVSAASFSAGPRGGEFVVRASAAAGGRRVTSGAGRRRPGAGARGPAHDPRAPRRHRGARGGRRRPRGGARGAAAAARRRPDGRPHAGPRRDRRHARAPRRSLPCRC